MAWVIVDDQAPRHHKMLKAGPDACWLWVCALAHCQSLLTDGFVADAALPMIGVPGAARAKRLADRLVAVGLLERAEGGYKVHDYHHHNATADEAREHRAKVSQRRSEAGRIGGIRSGIERRRLGDRREATKQIASKQTKQNEAPSHPIPISTPLPPASGGRITRAERQRAEELRRRAFGCTHEPRCDSYEACLVTIVLGLREQAATA